MEIILKNRTPSGEDLEAVFLPEKGMNLVSFRKGNLEVIDQSTYSQFEQRSAGLGALIGPHFYQRKAEIIPNLDIDSIFSHISYIKQKGEHDPFTHGVGRYAPWTAQSKESSFTAKLSGKDTWNGIKLSDLEGQNFEMTFEANLTTKGLDLSLAVVSDADSIVGIHYYYHLPDGIANVISRVQKTYLDPHIQREIPKDWGYDESNLLIYTLDKPTDFAFHPYPDPTKGEIILETKTHKIRTTYTAQSEENAWQLYHPQGASFVCIEPVSSWDPRHANLTVSHINIGIEILDVDIMTKE